MDPSAVERQIRQMADFIKLEAREKANEIRMKTKADADLEKQMAVLNAKTKLAEEFDRKEKALAMDQRVKASMEERLQRSRLLSARDEFIQKLAGEAGARLSAAAGSNAAAYSTLLKGLIKQGILRLESEAAVEVQCRPQDLALASKLAPAAAAEVTAECGRAVAVTVAGDARLASSSGGVTLSAAKGTIRCDNTLEARLGLALGDLTPAIRDVLFPSARAEVRVKPAVVVNPHSLKNKAAHAAAAAAHAAHGKPAAAAAFSF